MSDGDPAERRREYVSRNRNPLAAARRARDAEQPAEAEPPGSGRGVERSVQINQALRVGLLLLVGLISLLVLALLLSSRGLIRLPRFGAATVPTRPLLLAPTAVTTPAAGVLGVAGRATGDAPVPPAADTLPPIAPRFAAAYEAHGGVPILGLPIAAAELMDGREVQWFERARLEYWPEFAGTAYEVQLGLLGVEYTQGRQFARPQPFVSTPELRYFSETGHGLGGVFLSFWERNGGLDTFGMPISAEFDEVMPDGHAFRVQYFERARMEYHPEFAGTPAEVQLGLLGSALYRNEPRPSTVQPVPTPVPLP